MASKISIIGGGLAGSEAAWQAAEQGVKVTLYEMRGDDKGSKTPAHQTDSLAELVCSNSFRSDDYENNAVGLLHEEMRRLNGLIIACADASQVPAGSALAVDRDIFSEKVSAKLNQHPNIEIIRKEITSLDQLTKSAPAIVATGPLTSGALAEDIRQKGGEEALAFFDAIAPIVYKDSIDMDLAWAQSRYDKPGPSGEIDAYLNCPLSEEQYYAFINALNGGEKTEFKDWEKDTPYFEACLPIEVMAERGPETLRFGPMKPVGLTNPHKDEQPYAVVQLRQDNREGTLWNMVGFQTKLKHGAQADIFRTIPGLEKAVFARLGGIHRNAFLNSPRLLDEALRFKPLPHIRFAGQITGVEGYVESSAIGLIAGRMAAHEALGHSMPALPDETALKSLIRHVTGGHLSDGKQSFQPMNINFGLLPQIEAPRKDADGNRLRGKAKGREKKKIMTKSALLALDGWIAAQKSLTT